jgi:hypothetical protein
MLYCQRNSQREPMEFLLIHALADMEIDEFLEELTRQFPGDDYPVGRLDPDRKPDPAYTIRIPPLPSMGTEEEAADSDQNTVLSTRAA